MATDDLKEPKKIISDYLIALHKQIDEWGTLFKWKELRTLYFGGGTPSSIGADEIIKIVDHIGQYFSFEFIEELSLEVNPYPESVLWFIESISKHYKKWPKVRFSVGLQSMDNEVLSDSWRQYTSTWIVDFLRKLVRIKEDNVSFNFDMIAFGKFNESRKWNRQLRTQSVMDFFEDFAESAFADWFSLYTLELFEWSEWFHSLNSLHSHHQHWLGLKKYGSDDDIYEEFSLLKDIISNAGYERYELSNFSSAGRNSIHNRVYRNMSDYLAFWTSASWFVAQPDHIALVAAKIWVSYDVDTTKWVRRTNTKKIADYFHDQPVDKDLTTILSLDEFNTEKVFLWLRTMEWISGLSSYSSILEKDREQKVKKYVEQWFASYEDDNLRLTDEWMDIYNTIITDLMVL